MFRRFAAVRARTCAKVAATAFAGATLTYFVGIANTFSLDMKDTCVAWLKEHGSTAPEGFPSVRSSMFPLSSSCTWPGQDRVELVPSFVNPTVVGLLVAGVVATGLTTWAGIRAWRASPGGVAPDDDADRGAQA